MDGEVEAKLSEGQPSEQTPEVIESAASTGEDGGNQPALVGEGLEILSELGAQSETPLEAVEVEVVEADSAESDDSEDSGDDEQDTDESASEDTVPGIEDVGPVSDTELDQITRSAVKRAPSEESSTALAVRDPLGAYMAEVRKHSLLTREEEYDLAVRWVEQGDAEAGRRLVTANLRLVVKIANEYRRGFQNLLDLVQEGNVGLVKAVQKFDPYRGVKLSTYAGWWIRAYVLKYILNTWRLVKVGTTQNQRKLFFNLRKQQDALKAAGIEVTAENIADALDVSTSEVVEMQKRMGAPDQSLNAPLGADEDGGRTRMELVEDEGEDPEASVGANQFNELLSDKLRRFGATLSGRELEIFRDRLVAEDPVTLQSLGDRWQVSRERARQLEKRLVLRLREFLQSELGDAVQIALGHDT